jgi:hypothetical protein
MIRSILRMVPLLLLVFSLILILMESPLLTQPVAEGSQLPAGSLIAWLCLSMFPLSILVGIRYIRKPISVVYRFYNRAFILYTILGMGWGLLAYLLAGNWSFTFSSDGVFRGSDAAFDIFLAYTAFIVSFSLLTFIIFLVHRLIIHLKKQ